MAAHAAASRVAHVDTPKAGTATVLVPVQFGLDRTVAGRGVSRVDALRRRVGRSTYLLWVCLCTARDLKTGITRLSIESIATRFGFSERLAKDCLRRLERAELVTRIGWRNIGTPETPAWRYARKVWGSPPPVRGFELCAVPLKTVEFMTTTNGRGGARPNSGGKRPGAGRPKRPPGSSPQAGEKQSAKPESESAKHVLGVAEVISKAPPQEETPSSLLSLRGDVSFLKKRKAPSGAIETKVSETRPETLPSDGVPSASAPITPLAPNAAPVAPPAPLTPSAVATALAKGLGPEALALLSQPIGPAPGPRRKRHPVAFGEKHPLVPREVVISQLAPVVVPAPPKLDPHDLPSRHAWLMARWFEGAVEKRLRKQCWSFKSEKVPITRSKHYGKLLAAAAVFIDLEIAPAAWCAFMADLWLSRFGKGAPPIAWVFDPKRIVEWRGWFKSESNDYGGGRIIYSDRARELMTRQTLMRNDLCMLDDTASDHDIYRVVEKHFPNGLFAALCTEVVQEGNQLVSALHARIANGSFEW